MKNVLLTLALAIVCIDLSAQVKQQFQDDIYAQTTVVIKGDDMSDADILNDQFDIDEFGMDQIIRITIEEDEPTLQVQKEKILQDNTPEQIVVEETIEATNAITPKNNLAKGSSNVLPAKKATVNNSARYAVDGKRTKPSFDFSKKRNKKVKTKKHRVKRNRKRSCYRF